MRSEGEIGRRFEGSYANGSGGSQAAGPAETS